MHGIYFSSVIKRNKHDNKTSLFFIFSLPNVVSGRFVCHTTLIQLCTEHAEFCTKMETVVSCNIQLSDPLLDTAVGVSFDFA